MFRLLTVQLMDTKLLATVRMFRSKVVQAENGINYFSKILSNNIIPANAGMMIQAKRDSTPTARQEHRHCHSHYHLLQQFHHLLPALVV